MRNQRIENFSDSDSDVNTADRSGTTAGTPPVRIGFFEDVEASGFAPIALTRPVFELVCGQFSLRERLVRSLAVKDWGAVLRPYLADVYREEQPEAHVNDFPWLASESILLINGRWLPTAEDIQSLASATEEQVGRVGDTVVFMRLEPIEAALLDESSFDDTLLKIAATKQSVEAGGHVVSRPWDLVDLNPEILVSDFESRFSTNTDFVDPLAASLDPRVAVLGDPDNVRIHPTADIDPFVIIDARGGPVSIDAGVNLQAFTRVEGPCHIGRESQVVRANVKAGTTIGPVCRIGGEIEASIFHGFANKYHDGFLGHSYVCPWVNMGALTTNSDLKNDYSTVRVPLSGHPIESGSKKIGSFIGDHTKTALCSLFNTGSSIGVMTMILPGGELLPKHVPSFSRVWHGMIDDHVNLDASLETARKAMDRRSCDLTPAAERMLRHLYSQTRIERSAAVERFREKLMASM